MAFMSDVENDLGVLMVLSIERYTRGFYDRSTTWTIAKYYFVKIRILVLSLRLMAPPAESEFLSSVRFVNIVYNFWSNTFLFAL